MKRTSRRTTSKKRRILYLMIVYCLSLSTGRHETVSRRGNDMFALLLYGWRKFLFWVKIFSPIVISSTAPCHGAAKVEHFIASAFSSWQPLIAGAFDVYFQNTNVWLRLFFLLSLLANINVNFRISASFMNHRELEVERRRRNASKFMFSVLALAKRFHSPARSFGATLKRRWNVKFIHRLRDVICKQAPPE